MITILHIKSSSNLQNSVTRQIGVVVEKRLKTQYPNAKIIERDLVTTPIPHITPEFLGAMFSGNEADLKLSNQLIDELLSSDILVIEAPMYNFTVPSVLKSWIDHITRVGKTFRYTEQGSEGLAKGKFAILILGSGGVYSESPSKSMEHTDSYLRVLLSFLGITNVETIRIEGVAMGQDKAQAALAQATQLANTLVLNGAKFA